MRNPNDSTYYYSEQKTNSTSKSSSERSIDGTINPRLFIKRLIGLQVFSTSILFLVACLQGIAIGTNDWFVLNVNEYIPTAKGGLWFYCYVAANNYLGQYSCLKYEELPNYAIFINTRLYDSRILLICSSGFCFIILIIEIFGVICLTMADRRGDIVDSFVARRSSRWRLEKQPNEFLYPPTPKIRAKGTQSSKLNGIEELTNSARFTTSIVINANNELTETYRTIKPTGYFAYLAIALVSMVGSVMDFVLKVSGFALFDAYIARLLLSNTVFLAFRSYSYWMMVASIVLTIIFWLFKVFSTRYVVNLTKKLLLNSNINFVVSPTSTESEHSDLNAYESPQTNYATVTRLNQLNNQTRQTYPYKSSLVYNIDSNFEDLTSGSSSERSPSYVSDRFDQQQQQSNYFSEYIENGNMTKDSFYDSAYNIENKSLSVSQVVRF